jgi:hypothetical protein
MCTWASSKEREVREEAEKTSRGNRFAILAAETDGVFSRQENDPQVRAKVNSESAWKSDRKERKSGQRGPERESNLGYSKLRSWCPHCARGRAESRGHEKKAQDEGEAPIIGLDYGHMCSKQEKKEEKGTLDYRDEGRRGEYNRGEGGAEQKGR